jgi:hypothetical protein
MGESATPTYHVSVWDDPAPTYVCLLCPVRGLTLAEVTAHVWDTHAVEAVPTPQMDDLLAMRAASDAAAAGEMPQGQDAPVEEDVPHG